MEAEPSRKRLRRVKRSCDPCRKRKVKCQLINEDVETCAECAKTGAQCVLQQTETEPRTGNISCSVETQDDESRLERIESLLKRLVESQKASPPDKASPGTGSTAPESLWDDFLVQSTDSGSLPSIDHGLVAMPQPTDVKQSLLALLPSAHDAFTIVTNTTAWLWGAETPHGSVLTSNDTLQLLDTAAISKGSTMYVAKTLLLFAIYMQQLPARFDVQFLESQAVESAIELISERVKVFLVSHETLACSLDGVECLTLLSLLQINNGDLRAAWMTLRRGLDIARLNRLQDSFSLPARNSSCSDMALHRRLWLSVVGGETYCSLLLGLEPGIGIAPFGPDDEDWNDPVAEQDANVQRRICLVVARIAQRNSLGLFKDGDVLGDIDAALDRIQSSTTASWWRVPSFGQDRLLTTATEPNRLVCQLWFLQTRMFAHIPIAFGPSTDCSLDSLETCMEACRITLQRYLGLQHAKDHLSRCRTVDQSAFIAATILILAKVQLRWNKSPVIGFKYDSDRALLEQVVDAFEGIGKSCSRERVSRQVHEILSIMLDIGINGSRNDLLVEGSVSDLGYPLKCTTPFTGATNFKSGMEDIIASSIQPALDPTSPASRLIKALFTIRQSSTNVPKVT